ncbi:molybdopterin-dependent oxidoreductase [Jannaschia sp. Os4]|uniref:nitrate reductase n=1 Tax=Jannaschia sp. Os4 TaxID=2807617 RepID=UPI001939D7B1|nr:nitrate reductase [Jannaschia sp. Os4]MBM2576365.1 molybdopterin-dependent oxidoreductase [Jannaschia sp. Os4]
MTRTTCAYCGVGCGVVATPAADGLRIEGDPDHPANFGRLCSKGAALGETVGLEDRLLHPMVEGARATWDEAMGRAAGGFADTIAAHGPDSVAFYVSGQLLTEDYYVVNKLAKGFVGTANIDTNSRLCMASTVAGHRRAFGADTVPGLYADLEEADVVVLVGSNLAWCHPVLFQRLRAAKDARPGMRVVNVDPRRTATSEIADLDLRVAPGGDAALFARLLAHLHEAGAVDAGWVLGHVAGFDAALDAARAAPGETGLSAADLGAFLSLWTRTEKVVTVFGQGVNQSARGTDTVSAIINCHLATGRIGRPGMGPLSVTGQPNAMGGREVGGLSNTLACHLSLTEPAHRYAVRAFWDAPAMPEADGPKAVEMFERVADGTIRAIWIACTNPAVSLPGSGAVRAALEACPLVVVQDVTARTDTARLAHVLLPALAWGEKDGTVTNSDRCISRQRAVLPPPGEARADWAIFAELAARLGHGPAFDYRGPAQVFREHAALSGVAAALGSDFDISALAALTDAAYDALAPVHWPVTGARSGGRFFGDGRFLTPDGRARMHPVRAGAAAPAGAPLRLNTGRVRDQWHTMTRSGAAARLSAHTAEPFLEIHPADAAARDIAPASIVEVSGAGGTALLRALVTDRVRPGDAFAPIHWSGETSARACVSALVPPVTDPVSGQPASKSARVEARAWPARWFAFAVSMARPDPEALPGAYWARARVGAGWQTELAGLDPVGDWEGAARALLGLPDAELSAVGDAARGRHRLAFRRDGALAGALFVSPEPVALQRAHVAALLGEAGSPLAGRPAGDVPDPGPTVCACLGVGSVAIAACGARTVEAAGAATGAGTSCGSCRPEIAAILAAQVRLEAAE